MRYEFREEGAQLCLQCEAKDQNVNINHIDKTGSKQKCIIRTGEKKVGSGPEGGGQELECHMEGFDRP